MPPYKIIQTVYTSEPFPVMKARISEYFSNHGFVLGEDPEDNLRRNPLGERWSDENTRCSAVVYVSRSHYSLLGSGTSIILNNNRSSQANQEDVPETALRQFHDIIPNSISIDSHENWAGASNWLAEDLARLMSRDGEHPILISLDDRVTGVKSNPYLSDDDRMQELDAAAEDFLPPTTKLGPLRESLEALIGEPSWKGLSEKARTFLLNGFISFDQLDGKSTVTMECSGAAIQLSKALEETVVCRMLKPFRDFLTNTGTSIPSSSVRSLDKLRTYAQSTTDKKLELGTFATQLEFFDTDNTSTLPPTAAPYLSFLATLADPDYLQHQLAHELLNVTRTYRNPAAHPDVVDFSQLHSYFRLLIGDDQCEGLLPRLLSASEPANSDGANHTPLNAGNVPG